MLKKSALVLALFIFLISSSVALAATATLYPSDDGLIAMNAPDTNYGQLACLSLLREDFWGNTIVFKLPVFKFNFSSIPQNSKIAKANLKLYRCGNNAIGTAELKKFTGDWREGTLTWNNGRPSAQAGNDPSRESFTIHNQSFEDWDITRHVKDWVSGATPNRGFYLFPLVVMNTGFYSKEADNVNVRPKLVIEYSVPTPTPKPAIPAPKISRVRTENITQTQATIKWETDVSSDTMVFYGKDKAVYTMTASTSNLTKNHSLTLKNLARGSTYHYKIKSKTATSPEGSSQDHVFFTLKPNELTSTPTPTPTRETNSGSSVTPTETPDVQVIVVPVAENSDSVQQNNQSGSQQGEIITEQLSNSSPSASSGASAVKEKISQTGAEAASQISKVSDNTNVRLIIAGIILLVVLKVFMIH